MRSLLEHGMPSELVAVGSRLLLLFAFDHRHADHNVERFYFMGMFGISINTFK